MLRPISRATSLWVVQRAVWSVCRRLEEAGDSGGATVPQIVDEAIATAGRDIAYTTVATQLKMLEGKGLVTADKRGRNLYYHPTVDEPAAVVHEVDAFLDNVLHHDPQLMRIAIERISRGLDEARGGGKKGGKPRGGGKRGGGKR
jgi:predicted transcriptional regulator